MFYVLLYTVLSPEHRFFYASFHCIMEGKTSWKVDLDLLLFMFLFLFLILETLQQQWKP